MLVWNKGRDKATMYSFHRIIWYFTLCLGWRMPIHRHVTSLALLRIVFLIYKFFPTISQIFPLNIKVSVWTHPKNMRWKPHKYQAVSWRPVGQLRILPGHLQAWAQDPGHQHIRSEWRARHSSRGLCTAPSTSFKLCFPLKIFSPENPPSSENIFSTKCFPGREHGYYEDYVSHHVAGRSLALLSSASLKLCKCDYYNSPFCGIMCN